MKANLKMIDVMVSVESFTHHSTTLVSGKTIDNMEKASNMISKATFKKVSGFKIPSWARMVKVYQYQRKK